MGMKLAAAVLLALTIHSACALLTRPEFNGNAEIDFDREKFEEGPAKAAWMRIASPVNPVIGDTNTTISGWDIQAVYLQYDVTIDLLSVGVKCYSICGDGDGDGSPNGAEEGLGNYGGGGRFLMLVEAEPSIEADLFNNISSTLDGAALVFFPDFQVGTMTAEDPDNLFLHFDSYLFKEPPECNGVLHSFAPGSPCHTARRFVINNPDEGWRQGCCSSSTTLGVLTNSANPPAGWTTPLPVDGVKLAFLPPDDCVDDPFAQFFGKLCWYPNDLMPSLEFNISMLSKYGGFTFRPGIDPIVFASSFSHGTTGDNYGEELILPRVFNIPCGYTDACGVCLGEENSDNSTCIGCDGVKIDPLVSRPASYDFCGQCLTHEQYLAGLGNASCTGCDGIPNPGFPAYYDECGVCINKAMHE